MQLQHLFAACCLVQPVDILGHDSVQLTRSLQLRQLPVLFAGIVLWAVFTLLSAKISAERFEKVDL